MLLKTMVAYQLQNEHFIFVCYFFFLAGHFQPWPILLFFARDIVLLKVSDKIVKKQLTFDLYIRILRNCLAYFSQNPQIRNWCINWQELYSLSVHYFPRVFLSVQSRSIARVWNTHFIIFSFVARIHFQKEFFEDNLPFIPPNIILSWVPGVSTNTCNWQKLDQDSN